MSFSSSDIGRHKRAQTADAFGFDEDVAEMCVDGISSKLEKHRCRAGGPAVFSCARSRQEAPCTSSRASSQFGTQDGNLVTWSVLWAESTGTSRPCESQLSLLAMTTNLCLLCYPSDMLAVSCTAKIDHKVLAVLASPFGLPCRRDGLVQRVFSMVNTSGAQVDVDASTMCQCQRPICGASSSGHTAKTAAHMTPNFSSSSGCSSCGIFRGSVPSPCWRGLGKVSWPSCVDCSALRRILSPSFSSTRSWYTNLGDTFIVRADNVESRICSSWCCAVLWG